MREKRLLWNTITSILNQVVTVGCAFILPRLILKAYGSEVNGLIQSIQQFLAIIAFLDLGVGAVVQSSLYKPLAEGNQDAISQVMVSANRFFRKLATIIAVYVLFLSVAYTYICRSPFSVGYNFTLVLALGVSYFTQYFFGLKNQLLLIADQKAYVPNLLGIIVTIANNVVGCGLILTGYSIQVVKVSTAVILLLRPLLMELYVRRHYRIQWDISYSGEPIKQKWNGIAQHLASVVLISTDNIVLTLFSTLENVSVYSVYHLVLNGMNNLVLSFNQGTAAYFGNLIANQENDKLHKMFDVYECIYHILIVVIYSCVIALIMPFVAVYTKGVVDTNYIVPSFAYLICIANMMYCIRIPYNSLVLSAGHYKQTQTSAIIEMLINIVISVLTVIKLGLIGVAVGTLIAMLYRSLYLAWYSSEHIIGRTSKKWILHFIIDTICVFGIVKISLFIPLSDISYLGWLLMALKVGAISFIITMAMNISFFRKHLRIKDIKDIIRR